MTNKTELLPCPFCGSIPDVFPKRPEIEGNAFGQVRCSNNDCSAKPCVNDGEDRADDRGSDAYKMAAIKIWNTRAPSPEPVKGDDVALERKILFALDDYKSNCFEADMIIQRIIADVRQSPEPAVDRELEEAINTVENYLKASHQQTTCAWNEINTLLKAAKQAAGMK